MMPLSDNSSSSVSNTVRMTGVLLGQGTGGNDLINTNQTLPLMAMKTPEVFNYDEDGNLLSDGTFSYGWNAENRLVTVSNSTALVASYAYDYLGRRIFKIVNGGETTFLWDGNHIIRERTASTTNVYTWSSNGHLVTASLNGTNMFYCHDGNKNVADLVDVSGSVVAHYEFDPFGDTIVKIGSSANANPFRFSNEYFDSETGLIAYMLRYYEPPTGRFLNRDPIAEQGGLNIYGFVGNSPIANYDKFGLYTLGYARKKLKERGVKPDTAGIPGYYMSPHFYAPNTPAKYSDEQVFNEWMRLERSNTSWLKELTPCPKRLCFIKDGKPVNPDKSIWKKPGKANPEHKGAIYEMRSKATAGGHANQCSYDRNGVIMTGIPAGGTADFVSHGFNSGHTLHDLLPWRMAKKLGRRYDYYNVRPEVIEK